MVAGDTNGFNGGDADMEAAECGAPAAATPTSSQRTSLIKMSADKRAKKVSRSQAAPS